MMEPEPLLTIPIVNVWATEEPGVASALAEPTRQIPSTTVRLHPMWRYVLRPVPIDAVKALIGAR